MVRWPIAFALATVVMAAATVSWAPLRALNALVPSGTCVVNRDVAYGAGPRRRLDVYLPLADAPRPADGWPLVVFFYGGSWNRGERGDYRFVGEAMAARGVVAVIPDYRLYPEVGYPQFLEDSAAAVAWSIQAAGQLHADARRIYVMGHSAGGYNAAMLALDGRWLAREGVNRTQLAGWIGLAGPYDFLPIENPEVRPVFHFPASPPESQPIVYAGAASRPAFLGAAPDDSLVNPERNTRQMARALLAAGVPVTVRTYPNTNHLTLIAAFARPLRWLGPVLDDVVTFVESSAD
jgi:acetyl esterase/lipase